MVGAVTRSGLAHLCRPLTQGVAVVYMLHRFADPDRGVPGHDPHTLRSFLTYLRRGRYPLLDLQTVVSSLEGHGPPLRRAVAFTIDDGYQDLAVVAGPAFAEFDCPVTAFVTTGFLDGRLWLWWDQIDYVFVHTSRPSFAFDWEDAHVSYKLTQPMTRRRARMDFTARCKVLPDGQRSDAIRRLAALADVPVPERPPSAYAPITWDELRACEERGMTFGPHTVTHPILASADPAVAAEEIAGSWSRLQAEATRPVPIFAYPNGQPGDFGRREFGTLQETGLRAAVTAIEGFATAARFRAGNGAFQIPRFPLPDSLPYLIQQVSGLERLKFLLRRMD
jgi:peptidoglycan/xylan/chitin deacetylase (PgdA/CDA1 family)